MCSCAKLEHKLGIHGSPTCVLNYGDEGGAVGWMIGEPNRGLNYMFTMMNQAPAWRRRAGRGLAELPSRRRWPMPASASRAASSDAGRRDGADHRPSRRAPHAADDEGEDRRRPRHLRR